MFNFNSASVLSVVGMVSVAVASLLHDSTAIAAPPPGVFANLACEGTYRGHLQGICTDDKESVFWSFTDELVKTDREGKIVNKVPAVSHHGDLCFLDGKIYVAVNLGKFNEPAGQADSWVYVYDAATLAELAKHKTPEVVHGAGGMSYADGRFFVVGGLPNDIHENYVYEYSPDFKFIKRHVIASGHTKKGIQTAAYAAGVWWFGCYGEPHELLKTDKAFRVLGKWPLNKRVLDAAYGIVGLPDGTLLVARNIPSTKDKKHAGAAVIAVPDAQHGIVEKKLQQ